MSRSTPELVGEIIKVKADIPVQPFIDVANELVTECCGESGYTDERLTKIETWLAAHFYAIRDPRNQQENAGDTGRTIESKVDLGLNVTRYGQQAMMLDTKGGLARLNKEIINGQRKPAPQVLWMGTEYNC